jgi:hypothetical protein
MYKRIEISHLDITKMDERLNHLKYDRPVGAIGTVIGVVLFVMAYWIKTEIDRIL